MSSHAELYTDLQEALLHQAIVRKNKKSTVAQANAARTQARLAAAAFTDALGGSGLSLTA